MAHTAAHVFELGLQNSVLRYETSGVPTILRFLPVHYKLLNGNQPGLQGRGNNTPQGRLLGGSSALNGLAFVVPSKSTLEYWAQLGNPGWEHDSFSWSLAKSYSLTDASNVLHGDRPLKVTVPEEDSQWQWPKAWRDTLQGLWHPTELVAFSGQHYGGLMGVDTIDPATKKKSYAANAYLDQAKSRENLTVWMGVLVNRVIFWDSSDSVGNVRATGV